MVSITRWYRSETPDPFLWLPHIIARHCLSLTPIKNNVCSLPPSQVKLVQSGNNVYAFVNAAKYVPVSNYLQTNLNPNFLLELWAVGTNTDVAKCTTCAGCVCG